MKKTPPAADAGRAALENPGPGGAPPGPTATGSVQPAEAILSLHSGNARGALLALRSLRNSLWERKSTPFALEGLQGPFRTLLRRRGYFVSSPSELSATLEDIRALGPGFDLYDVAEELAALDMLRTECLQLSSRPLFPELIRFAPRCVCGRHPMDSQ